MLDWERDTVIETSKYDLTLHFKGIYTYKSLKKQELLMLRYLSIYHQYEREN